MAGKFLKPGALVDTIRSEQRMNAVRKRSRLANHPVSVTSCGCPDPNCGAWHTIIMERTIPTVEECATLISDDNKNVRLSRSDARPNTALEPTAVGAAVAIHTANRRWLSFGR